MKRLCADCEKRPVAVYRVPTKRGHKRFKAMGKGHDLCMQCWRALRSREAAKARRRPDTWGR